MSCNLAVVEPVVSDVEFESKGYTVIKNMLSRDMLDIAYRYYLSYAATSGYYAVSDDVRALDRYADALGEAMMPQVQEAIEAKTGRRLLPTYSFARVYTTASRLSRHVDRGACEISATMTVGYTGTSDLWPIMVESEGVDLPIALDVGDALIYRGMDLPHWRESLKEGVWCQLFFHFVEADGAMAGEHYDRRDSLGPVWPGPLVARRG